MYYLPQQTVYNNIQHYITKDDQVVCYSTVENNTVTELLDQHDNLKKQKKKSRRQYNSGFTLNTIWKTITAPNANKLLQKAKIAYENGKLDALNIYSQILQAYPTNCVALYNRALIKRKRMGNIQKAMFDIETAIEVNNVYDNTWYQSLNMYVNLQNKEQDIKPITGNCYQYYVFDVIYEFVNKLEHFDVKWFKHLVDSCSARAIDKLDDINQWQSLCSYQYGTDNYTRWYNTVVTWYNKYNNTKYNHMHTKAFFEKVYYMQKSKRLCLIA